MEKKQLTLPEHLSSPPVFSGVRVIRSLVFCVCFVHRYLSFFTFSFGFSFLLSVLRFTGTDYPLSYLQTLLTAHFLLCTHLHDVHNACLCIQTDNDTYRSVCYKYHGNDTLS